MAPRCLPNHRYLPQASAKSTWKKSLGKGTSPSLLPANLESLSFPGTTDKNYLALPLDVTSKPSIDKAFAAAIEKFGRVDVVVNNAGYGLCGCFEELSDQQIRQQMEINFFGLIDVTRKALETMREQKPSGGQDPATSLLLEVNWVWPTFSIYNASKWAVEGFTEAISKEMKPEWGIHIMAIEPGGFRTDWSGRSMTFPDKHPAYDHIDARANMKKRHGTQAGDPKKAAPAMYEFAVMDNPPLRMCIGSDAYGGMMGKIDGIGENYTKYEKIAKSTDHDDYKPPS